MTVTIAVLVGCVVWSYLVGCVVGYSLGVKRGKLLQRLNA
jgi:NhaP-type Na+/H+ or K+/H+ antiporter